MDPGGSHVLQIGNVKLDFYPKTYTLIKEKAEKEKSEKQETPKPNAKRILKEISFVRGKTIIPGKTLVIFDEIQFCPNALTSLKYFAEELPELHIACAGSYLGIHLAKNAGSFPVGKVDFLTLHPMNFEEYLLANGEEAVHAFLSEIQSGEGIPKSLTAKLEGLYKDYLITGGMPETKARRKSSCHFYKAS